MSRETRSIAEIDANRLDRDLFHLAGRIDQFAEMTARGKKTMDRELIKAASALSSARAAVREYMHENDRVVTSGINAGERV